ncbi:MULTISPECIES: hypothetical protein [unclassified Mesorhizobium]|uniref:hypothetical protein n=2 Tax=unclassified Mesorhizobium TaxID=325217 RepID=UPI001FE1B792|nr:MULTISPECIES: hypothetical protein [unclassified Mesorhizobium]MDG4912704.1 hypothetical protein [Mesorhizobium sp. WSM4983]
MMMKAFLGTILALGLSVSAASANCPAHAKDQASVDAQQTASVDKSDTSTSTEIKKETPAKSE